MWCTNRLLWRTNSDFYGIRTPPFMPYEPFLLGVGVAFNLLRKGPHPHTFSLTKKIRKFPVLLRAVFVLTEEPPGHFTTRPLPV